MSESNCAVGSDGKLKDATDIDWYNDPDDNDPIAPSGPSSTLQASSSASQIKPAPDTFSVLLAKGNKPAAITAGSHRSTHAPKPSAKVREAKESSKKRSTADDTDIDTDTEAPAKKYRQSTRSVILDSDEEAPVQHHLSRRATVDEADIEGNDEVMAEVDEDEDVDMAYAHTKGLGDEDRAVCSLLFDIYLILTYFFKARKTVPKDDRTADIKSVFSRQTKLNTDTGKTETVGWECNVCR
jgi:hypothetical protein